MIDLQNILTGFGVGFVLGSGVMFVIELVFIAIGAVVGLFE